MKFGTAGRCVHTKTCFANLINMVLTHPPYIKPYTTRKAYTTKSISSKMAHLQTRTADSHDTYRSATRPGLYTLREGLQHTANMRKTRHQKRRRALYKTEKSLAPTGNSTTIPRLSSM